MPAVPVVTEQPAPAPADRPVPTLRHRLEVRWFRIVDRLHLGVISVHLAVGSLIGVEGLAVVLGFSAAWPIAIPLVMIGLTLVALTRGRVRSWFRRRRS